jgi:hypothetical protein
MTQSENDYIKKAIEDYGTEKFVITTQLGQLDGRDAHISVSSDLRNRLNEIDKAIQTLCKLSSSFTSSQD